MGRHSAAQGAVYGDTSYGADGDALGEPDYTGTWSDAGHGGHQGYAAESGQAYDPLAQQVHGPGPYGQAYVQQQYAAYDAYGAYDSSGGYADLQVDQHGQYAPYTPYADGYGPAQVPAQEPQYQQVFEQPYEQYPHLQEPAAYQQAQQYGQPPQYQQGYGGQVPPTAPTGYARPQPLWQQPDEPRPPVRAPRPVRLDEPGTPEDYRAFGDDDVPVLPLDGVPEAGPVRHRAEPEPRPPRPSGGRAAARKAAAPHRGGRRTAFAAGGVVVTGAVLAGAVVMHMPGGDGNSAQAAGPGQGGTGTRDTQQAASRSNDRGAVVPTSGPSALPMPTPGATGTLTDRLKLKYDLAPDLSLGGRFSVVPGSQPAPGKGRLYTYRVEIEDGLPLDGELFAQTVQATLNDPRSWGHGGTKTYARTDGPNADFVIRLASPGTTGRLCMMSGLDVREENVSCDSAATPWVVINAYRWAQGSTTYGDDMYDYRHMLINHEVGHRMGHNHEYCTAQGVLAPVMMQQTKTLTTGQFTCLANPWPFPDGRPADAPEQA